MSRRSDAAPKAGPVAKLAAPPEVFRTRIVELVTQAAPRLVRVIAPAGYGKTTLVHQLATRFELFAVCDCDGATNVIELSRRVVGALTWGMAERTDSLARQMVSLQEADPDHWSELALRAWGIGNLPATDLFVFDNLEQLAAASEVRELIARLLATAPASRTVAFCARVPVAARLPRHLVPHLAVTIGAEELAFDHEEFLAAFAGASVSRRVRGQIERMTRGWPLAILLFRRLVMERRFEAKTFDEHAIAFSDLYDYLSDHVLALLQSEQLTALLACTAIPEATEADVELALEGAAPVREALAGILPFVARSKRQSFAPHPLVARTLRERFPERCAEILERVADAHRDAGTSLRAAQLYLTAGDTERAAAALNESAALVAPTWPVEFGQVVTQINEETAVRYPALYTATSILRASQITPEEWAAKVETVWGRLPAGTPAHVRASAFGCYAAALMNLGKLEEVAHAVSAYRASLDSEDYAGAMSVALIRGGLDAWLGRFPQHQANRANLAPAVASSAGWNAQFLYEMEARMHRVRGDWAEERRVLEHALELARKSNMPTIPLWVLTYQTFGAWLAGDDRYYEARLSELEGHIYEGVAKGFSFFVDCARGRAESASAGYERPEIRSYAFLLAAGTASSDDDRAKWAARALSAADTSAQPFTRVLAYVALSEIDARSRDQLYDRAASLAVGIESEPLHQAIVALRRRSGESGMLDAFARRFERARSRSCDALSIDLLAGQVRRGPMIVGLMRREFELLSILALKRKTMAADELLESIWPNHGGPGNVVRVYVARVRSRFGNDVIAREREGYRLAAPATVDLVEIEVKCRNLTIENLDDETIASLWTTFEALCNGAPSWLLQREWFLPYVPRIEDLCRRLGLLIARYRLANDDSSGALAAVAELVKLDPCDEAAREVAIRARLAKGDQIGAIREYNMYRDVLSSSLGAEPPRWLAALVSVGWHRDRRDADPHRAPSSP
jgi:DNA-binding SARP family transcriptional activator